MKISSTLIQFTPQTAICSVTVEAEGESVTLYGTAAVRESERYPDLAQQRALALAEECLRGGLPAAVKFLSSPLAMETPPQPVPVVTNHLAEPWVEPATSAIPASWAETNPGSLAHQWSQPIEPLSGPPIENSIKTSIEALAEVLQAPAESEIAGQEATQESPTLALSTTDLAQPAAPPQPAVEDNQALNNIPW